jgi:DNA repair exonuclease SbcCD ATPase subunit
VEGLDEKVETIKNNVKEALSQKYVDEVKENRRSITLTNARLDAVENVVKSLNSNLREVETTAKKFEGFEKLSMLNKDVEEKLERFKLMEGEIQRLSNHVEMIYGTFDDKLNKMENKEKEVSDLTKGLDGVRNEIDKIRVDMLSLIKKDDIDKRIEEKMKNIGSGRGPLTDSMGKLYNRLSSLESAQTEDFRKIEILNNRINYLADESIKMEDLEKKFGEGAKEKPEIPKVDDIYKSLSNLEDRFAVLENNIAQIIDPAAVIEAQVTEFINRFIFLESRLAAIEASLQKVTNVQPIILE